MFLKYLGVGGVVLSCGKSLLLTRFRGGESVTTEIELNGMYVGVWKGVC